MNNKLMPEDNIARFKQILSKLPEEKRKLLYERLHNMPQSEREAFIVEFIKKYDERKHEHEAKKTQTPAAHVTAPRSGSSQKSEQHKNSNPQRKTDLQKNLRTDKSTVPSKKPSAGQRTQTKKSHDDENAGAPKRVPAPRKHLDDEETAPKKNSSLSIVIGILVALIIVGAMYFIYLFNKNNIDNKFNEMFGMPPSEMTETSSGLEEIMGPEPKHFPTDTPTPVPATPTPSPVPVNSDHPDLTGLVIVLDPGHQQDYDYGKEESIPGTTADKDRGTPGAVGVDSGIKEYELTMEYSLIIKEYLEGCGAEVILTRESNDVSISNIERAAVATDNNADCFIRIHADSAPDSEIKGVKVYVPATGKYSSSASEDGNRLAETVADAIGSSSLGSVQSNMYTGLNHADSVRSYQLVIGYLSNSDDDALLEKDDTAYNVAVAISEFLGQ